MKKYILFILKLILAYGLAMALYGILFSSAAAQAADNDEAWVAAQLLGLFGALAYAIFNMVFVVQFAKDSVLRRAFRQATQGRALTTVDYLRYTLREVLIFTAIYAAVQLPYCIFYTAFGYDHVHAIIVDQFFVMAAGVYTLCGGNGYLGLMMSTLFFASIQLMARTVILRRWDVDRLQHADAVIE